MAKNAIEFDSVVICAMFSDNTVALVDLYSFETQKQLIKLLISFFFLYENMGRGQITTNFLFQYQTFYYILYPQPLRNQLQKQYLNFHHAH